VATSIHLFWSATVMLIFFLIKHTKKIFLNSQMLLS
jgi:hypothetical protein